METFCRRAIPYFTTRLPLSTRHLVVSINVARFAASITDKTIITAPIITKNPLPKTTKGTLTRNISSEPKKADGATLTSSNTTAVVYFTSFRCPDIRHPLTQFLCFQSKKEHPKQTRSFTDTATYPWKLLAPFYQMRVVRNALCTSHVIYARSFTVPGIIQFADQDPVCCISLLYLCQRTSNVYHHTARCLASQLYRLCFAMHVAAQ